MASFIAGAPANDPKVVVLISIRKPNVKLRKGYTGGTVAAPVAAGILEKTLTYLNVPPRFPTHEHSPTAVSRRQTRPSDPEQEHSW
ncbi:MAG: hypothetical protein A2Y77_10185 [Planctomycetes bacterium RBG_13_62_9]|nr:MAG: hypothetical protein A2Y77_10185 [Planctomycetes bacterium RBG_13_62_9]